jgi:hypothetical protein
MQQTASCADILSAGKEFPHFYVARRFITVFTKHRHCALSRVTSILSSPSYSNFHYQFKLIKSRRMRWAGYVACMEEGRKVYRVLVGKREGKRPLGRPRRRWEYGIRMDLREIGWGVEWLRQAQDRDRWGALMNAVMNLRVLAPRGWLVSRRPSYTSIQLTAKQYCASNQAWSCSLEIGLEANKPVPYHLLRYEVSHTVCTVEGCLIRHKQW